MLSNKDKKISILGAGWLGFPLAKRLQTNPNYLIRASSRNLLTLNALEKYAIDTCFLNIKHDSISCSDPLFFDADILIINFPPQRILDIETYHLQQFQQLQAQLSPDTNIIFISSTSVYPPMGNIAISEDCLEPPSKSSGKALILVEKYLQQHFSKVLILRSGGLFGRNRPIRKFLSKKIYEVHPQERVNLIHQKDLIEVIEKSITLNLFGETLNAVSNEHPLKQKLYQKKANEKNLAPPKFFINEHKAIKLISNQKINQKIKTLSWKHSKKHLQL